MWLKTAASIVAGLTALAHIGSFVYARRMIEEDLNSRTDMPFGLLFGYLIMGLQVVLLIGTISTFNGLTNLKVNRWLAVLEACVASWLAPISALLFGGLASFVVQQILGQAFEVLIPAFVMAGLLAPFVGIIRLHFTR